MSVKHFCDVCKGEMNPWAGRAIGPLTGRFAGLTAAANVLRDGEPDQDLDICGPCFREALGAICDALQLPSPPEAAPPRTEAERLKDLAGRTLKRVSLTVGPDSTVATICLTAAGAIREYHAATIDEALAKAEEATE